MILNLAEVEYLVHKAEHSFRVPAYQGKVLAGSRREGFILQNFSYRTAYQGQRGTQFVRYIGEKAQFDIGELLFHIYTMTQAINIEQHVYNSCGEQDEQQTIEQPCPVCFPECGEYMDGECADIICPYTVTVGRLYL